MAQHPFRFGVVVTLARVGAVTVLAGTVGEMSDRFLARRDKLAIPYVMASDEPMEAFAPVVERLAGR